MRKIALILWMLGMVSTVHAAIDLSRSAVILWDAPHSTADNMAVTVLQEEVQKRTDLRWPIAPGLDESRPLILITTKDTALSTPIPLPDELKSMMDSLRPEGFCIYTDLSQNQPRVWIVGADPRGTLYGVGCLLRKMNLSPNSAQIAVPLSLASSPAYPLRGHQLGYRNRANSYDAWDSAKYEQYIRELILFFANNIENIPF